MPANNHCRKLGAEEVSLLIDPDSLGFQTTAELDALDEIVGQPRAMKAFDLGLGIKHPTYHIYVAGMKGTERLELIRKIVGHRISEDHVPSDWFYVNNFDESDRPLAVSLPAGQGIKLKTEMDSLVEKLFDSIPKAFQQEDFGKEKERLRKRYRQQGQAVLEELEQVASKRGMTVQQLPDGEILFIPLKDGKPMTKEEVQELSPKELAKLEKNQDELVDVAGDILRRQSEIEKQLSTDVKQVAREFAQRLVDPLIDKISEKYKSEKLQSWLIDLKTYVVEHLELFREEVSLPPALAQMKGFSSDEREHDRFVEFRINLVVDNGKRKKEPVIVEDAPNYRNLFGTIERIVDRSGSVTTNFSRIKSGSLLRANGGYLILNLMDALVEPSVWKELKRTLKSGSLEIQSYDPYSMFTVSALKPESIPLNVKLIAVGEPLIYHLLFLQDEDFREIFRVKADFDDEMERTTESGNLYGRFVRKLSLTEEIADFDASGVCELVKFGSRLSGHREKSSCAFTHIADVVREADFWAKDDGSKTVSAEHVRQAIREKVYRSDLVADKIRELIDEGTLLINIEGTAVGQINGLAVANLGDYTFGRPSRLTASVGVGTSGIVNIERESRLSGRTFDKGVLILEGYLRNTYRGTHPLAFSASIAMEQSYGGIDGDSASIAELVCLLSALAEIPIRQEIAVTGSINQWGESQAIGGANEKIEGFFDVCQKQGLTGQQGVCIPASNVKNLILRSDVVEAVRKQRFHIWSVENVDEAFELFSGLPAGSLDDEESFHGKVFQQMKKLTEALREQRAGEDAHTIWVPGLPETGPQDPRPPLPGRECKESTTQ